MSRVKIRSMLSKLALLSVLILAACGSSATSHSKTGGTFTTTYPYTQFTNFNPFLSAYLYGSQGLAYEPLLYINRFDNSVTPWLATKYAFSTDGTMLTFTLRSGVTWTDGTPFTAADVVFSFDLLKQYPAIDRDGIWQHISSVTAVDTQTVTVTFTSPSLPLLWNVGGQVMMLPEHIWSSLGDPTKAVIANPVGTGPFELESANSQAITLKANPHYWQVGKPYIAKVRVLNMKDSTAGDLLLQSGGVDLYNFYTANFKQFAAASSENRYWWPATGTENFFFSLTKTPFNDVAVRKAISLVLDRNAMVQQGEGDGTTVASPTGLVLPQNQSWVDPTLSGQTWSAPDIAQAQATLAAAGYTKGSDGYYQNKDGSPITIHMMACQCLSDVVTDSQIAVGNLKALGFNADLAILAIPQYVGGVLSGGYDAWIAFWIQANPTPYYGFAIGLSSSTIGESVFGNNERWSDPATDALLAQYANATDQATQTTAIQGLEQIMVNQLPVITLFNEYMPATYTTSRFTGWPSSSKPYVLPDLTFFPDNEVLLTTLYQK